MVRVTRVGGRLPLHSAAGSLEDSQPHRVFDRSVSDALISRPATVKDAVFAMALMDGGSQPAECDDAEYVEWAGMWDSERSSVPPRESGRRGCTSGGGSNPERCHSTIQPRAAQSTLRNPPSPPRSTRRNTSTDAERRAIKTSVIEPPERRERLVYRRPDTGSRALVGSSSTRNDGRPNKRARAIANPSPGPDRSRPAQASV